MQNIENLKDGYAILGPPGVAALAEIDKHPFRAQSSELADPDFAIDDKAMARIRAERVRDRSIGPGNAAALPMMDSRHRSTQRSQVLGIARAHLGFGNVSEVFHV
jgi:hypothetical protein